MTPYTFVVQARELAKKARPGIKEYRARTFLVADANLDYLAVVTPANLTAFFEVFDAMREALERIDTYRPSPDQDIEPHTAIAVEAKSVARKVLGRLDAELPTEVKA